jgi:hypothetical protein
VSFVAITLCVASQRVIPKVSIYFVIDSVRELLDTPTYFSPEQEIYTEIQGLGPKEDENFTVKVRRHVEQIGRFHIWARFSKPVCVTQRRSRAGRVKSETISVSRLGSTLHKPLTQSAPKRNYRHSITSH